MKKVLALVLTAVLAFACFAFVGCNTQQEESKYGNQKLVALIALHGESSTYDKNFIDAFKTAAKNKGLTNKNYAIVTDIPESAACEEKAKDFADQGYKAVFADSFGHGPFMVAAAEAYSDVQFYHATGTGTSVDCPANFHNAFASIYEGRYLAGYAAGLKLNTMKDKAVENNFKVGYIGAYTYAEVISGYTSWYLGLCAALDEGYTATMEVQFTGSWYDEAGEKNAAETLIGRGAVLVSQHADSMGAPTACDTAGVPNVSYNGSTGKNTLVAYSKINWVPYFEMMIDAATGGAAVAKDWTGSIATGSVQYEVGPAAVAGTADTLKTVEAELKAGTRKVFDCSKFTVTIIPPSGEEGDFGTNTNATVDENGHLTAYNADVEDYGNFVGDTNVIKTVGGITFFDESTFRSAPYFDVQIDGITLLNAII